MFELFKGWIVLIEIKMNSNFLKKITYNIVK
jgi:hypothetical protein